MVKDVWPILKKKAEMAKSTIGDISQSKNVLTSIFIITL